MMNYRKFLITPDTNPNYSTFQRPHTQQSPNALNIQLKKHIKSKRLRQSITANNSANQSLVIKESPCTEYRNLSNPGKIYQGCMSLNRSDIHNREAQILRCQVSPRNHLLASNPSTLKKKKASAASHEVLAQYLIEVKQAPNAQESLHKHNLNRTTNIHKKCSSQISGFDTAPTNLRTAKIRLKTPAITSYADQLQRISERSDLQQKISCLGTNRSENSSAVKNNRKLLKTKAVLAAAKAHQQESTQNKMNSDQNPDELAVVQAYDKEMVAQQIEYHIDQIIFFYKYLHSLKYSQTRVAQFVLKLCMERQDLKAIFLNCSHVNILTDEWRYELCKDKAEVYSRIKESAYSKNYKSFMRLLNQFFVFKSRLEKFVIEDKKKKIHEIQDSICSQRTDWTLSSQFFRQNILPQRQSKVDMMFLKDKQNILHSQAVCQSLAKLQQKCGNFRRVNNYSLQIYKELIQASTRLHDYTTMLQGDKISNTQPAHPPSTFREETIKL